MSELSVDYVPYNLLFRQQPERISVQFKTLVKHNVIEVMTLKIVATQPRGQFSLQWHSLMRKKESRCVTRISSRHLTNTCVIPKGFMLAYVWCPLPSLCSNYIYDATQSRSQSTDAILFIAKVVIEWGDLSIDIFEHLKWYMYMHLMKNNCTHESLTE